MVESQPGTVTSFNPSVSLSGFSANTRDHLIFNENQLVLAKVQQTQPVFAYAYSRGTGGITTFDAYKNTVGKYVYIDGSYQALTTGGVPTGDVHRIVVGFDQQVTTDRVIFWSTSYVDTSFITMQYSFDNETWFEVGTITWAYVFDDTIARTPADEGAPLGEFRYTGTFSSSRTARYWRFKSDIETTWVSGTSTTLTVVSTTGFPSISSRVYLFSAADAYKAYFGYTGKTSITFTGRNPATYTSFSPGDKIVDLAHPFGNGVTEIQILPITAPILQHWNSDGSTAVGVELEGENYYHLTYDKTDDVYYALGFSNELLGSPPDPNDNFDADTGFTFDPLLWQTGGIASSFVHNTASGTLDYRSSTGDGWLETTYYVVGDVTASIDLVALIQLNSYNGYFGLGLHDFDTGNEYFYSGLKGPYLPDSRGDGAAATVYRYNPPGGPGADGWELLSSTSVSPKVITGVDVLAGAVATASLDIYTCYVRLWGNDGFEASFLTSTAGPDLKVTIVDTETVLVGDYTNTGIGDDAGAVRVYTKDVDSWVASTTIRPMDASAYDYFGRCLASSNGKVAIGASIGYYSTGKVYIYERVLGVWTETTQIAAVGVGRDVAIDGDTLVVPCLGEELVNVYVYAGGAWVFQQELVASDPHSDDWFGFSVDISGDTIVVGAPYVDDVAYHNGAAYVFTRSGGVWTEVAKLYGSNTDPSRKWGFEVAISGNALIMCSTFVSEGSDTFAYNGSSWVNSAAGLSGTGAAMGGSTLATVVGSWLHIYESLAGSGVVGGWVKLAEVTSSDATTGVAFSSAQAAETSMVGVITQDDYGVLSGAVYAFDLVGTNWEENDGLFPLDPAAGKQFGYSVAIDAAGSTAVIGAIGDSDDTGAGYIFGLTGTTWSQTYKLTVSGLSVGDKFGYAMGLNTDTLVVGAPYTDGETGAAYVFDRDGGNWSLEAVISGSDALAGDRFGSAVTVYGDKIAVGAPYHDAVGVNAGAVYLYNRDGGAWTQEDKVVSSGVGDTFGAALSLYDGVLSVGAPGNNSSALESGAVYVYEDNVGSWEYQQRLKAADPEAGALFGFSVSSAADLLAVGAPKEDNSSLTDNGAAYIFENNGSAWSERTKVPNTYGFSGDNFGHTVAAVSGTVFVGKYYPVPGATWVSIDVFYFDTVAGAAELQNFKVYPDGLDFSVLPALKTYVFTYSLSGNTYSATVNGEDAGSVTPGVSRTLSSSDCKVSFTLVNLSTPTDGAAFTAEVRFSELEVVNNTVTSGIGFELLIVGTNTYSRYREAGGAFTTLSTGSIPTGVSQRICISASSDDDIVHVAADNFSLTGDVFSDSPVLSVVSLNKDGELVQVAGVSDSDGYVIKRFDVINDTSAVYNDYMTPVVGIATNAGTGSGGEIYIKVGTDLYKYLKSTLPLDLEDGSSASVTTTGEIPSLGVANFAYNGYSQGGLSYIEYVADLSSVFLKSISTIDLTAVSYKAKLDVASISYPFTWNVSDLSTLYYVSGTALKLYDLNETKAAFANVTSDKQVLAAGTAETATITAQVLNVYGEPKSTKSMVFSVSAGDGAISPAVDCSDINGEGTTTYTVGSSVGTATITVTVSDISC